MKPGKTYGIPGMIDELDILSKGQSIECVVVTEHGNIESAFQLLEGNGALPGSEVIMASMTGGFPDLASREGLDLQSKYLTFL